MASHKMLNGIIAAVVPNTVPTIKRVTGNKIKSKIIKWNRAPDINNCV